MKHRSNEIEKRHDRRQEHADERHEKRAEKVMNMLIKGHRRLATELLRGKLR